MSDMTLKPVEQKLLLLLGWVQLQCAQPAHARTFFDAVLSAEPQQPAARKALVVALLPLEQGAQAEQHCEHLLAQGENDPALWACLSRAQQVQGQLERARRTYDHFLGLRDTHA